MVEDVVVANEPNPHLMLHVTSKLRENLKKRFVGWQDYIHNFLFDGYESLGTKTFLDYFPLYRGPDGSVLKKRSVAGRAYSTRPWDEEGRFIGNKSV